MCTHTSIGHKRDSLDVFISCCRSRGWRLIQAHCYLYPVSASREKKQELLQNKTEVPPAWACQSQSLSKRLVQSFWTSLLLTGVNVCIIAFMWVSTLLIALSVTSPFMMPHFHGSSVYALCLLSIITVQHTAIILAVLFSLSCSFLLYVGWGYSFSFFN